jgi:hypothetical protein
MEDDGNIGQQTQIIWSVAKKIGALKLTSNARHKNRFLFGAHILDMLSRTLTVLLLAKLILLGALIVKRQVNPFTKIK